MPLQHEGGGDKHRLNIAEVVAKLTLLRSRVWIAEGLNANETNQSPGGLFRADVRRYTIRLRA